MSFGIAKDIKSEVRVCTPDLLNQVLDAPLVARTCAEIEDALEKCRRGELTPDEYETIKSQLKKRLPILTPHATFRNGRRKNDEAIPSGLSIYDLDHIANPQSRWAEIEPRKEELGIMLTHITPSTEGLRLVFIRPNGMSLADAQAWMARQLGDTQYDACVKDYARCSFLVPREYVLWMDVDALFAPRITQINTDNNLPSDGIQDGNKENNPCKSVKSVVKNNYPQTFKGIPYADIIQEWFRQNGGEPEPGERNSKLHRLASHLRYITDNSEEHLLQILPNFGLKQDEMKQLIHSACIAKFYGIPKALKKLLGEMQSTSHAEEPAIINQSQGDAPVPPPMPTELPPLIELLVSRTPDLYKPAVAHAVFPALGAHLWRTTFRYIDNTLHEATLMNVLMAGTGAGKNCITEPINRILADIRRRDKENMLREKAWKKEMQSTGANKTKRQRPDGLVIQEIDPDMTNAAFVQRLADAEGRFLYTRMNEIDQFDALKTANNRKSQFQIMCLAFDPGNVYGQTRIGTGSVTERVCIRFNWNASTTIQKGQAYFRYVLTDGPISRINFCTIPEREIGSPMPVYGTYDDAFDRELSAYIERLNAVRGQVDCPEAFALAGKLSEECAEFARLSQSRVFENLSFRANVIAYLKACVLYVAHGCRWDKTMDDFIRWSLQYDLWCKMKFFGDAIEQQEETSTAVVRTGPQNLLDLLPDTFTREEAARMRQRQGIRRGNVQMMLGNWRKRGYIQLKGNPRPDNIDQQVFEKTAMYLTRGKVSQSVE